MSEQVRVRSEAVVEKITFCLSSLVKRGHKICVSFANQCHAAAMIMYTFFTDGICSLAFKYKGS